MTIYFLVKLIIPDDNYNLGYVCSNSTLFRGDFEVIKIHVWLSFWWWVNVGLFLQAKVKIWSIFQVIFLVWRVFVKPHKYGLGDYVHFRTCCMEKFECTPGDNFHAGFNMSPPIFVKLLKQVLCIDIRGVYWYFLTILVYQGRTLHFYTLNWKLFMLLLQYMAKYCMSGVSYFAFHHILYKFQGWITVWLCCII